MSLDQTSESAYVAQLQDLLHDCVGSAPAEEADRIREAADLLWPPLGAGHDWRGAIEAMLRAGACESAVLALIGAETSFMLSRGGSGSCLAAVVLPDGSEEMISQAATLALAMLAAHISAQIADLEGDSAARSTGPLAVGMRLN